MQAWMIIGFVIQWIVVPCTMIGLLLFARVITRSGIRNPDTRVSARAGFWAGIVLFVIYAIANLGRITNPSFAPIPMSSFLIVLTPIGMGAGFVFLWLVRTALPTRYLGLFTLTLTAVSTSALFTYVFMDGLRTAVLYLTLGAALGILLYIVVFPASLRGILD